MGSAAERANRALGAPGRANRASDGPGRSPARAILLPLCLCVIVFTTFASAVGHDFVIWDDNLHITHNPKILSPCFENLIEVWRRPMLGLYVPLSYTLFMLEVWLTKAGVVGGGGDALDPRLFHIVQLCLHAISVLLVYRILRGILGVAWASAMGALVFALHPLQVESVAWISETRGVLCAVFALLALDLYLRHARTRAPGVSRAIEPARAVSLQLCVATVCFAASLLAKPSSVSLPLAALILDRWLVRREWRSVLWSLTPWFVLAVLAAWINKAEQADQAMHFVAPLWARPFIATDALAFYLGKLVWPARLVADYGRTPQRIIELKGLYFSWIAPAACLAALFLVRERRVLAIACGLFAVALLPVLGLIPFAYQDISTVADRYVYLAMLGPALAVGAWLTMFKSEILVGLVSIAIAGSCAASWMQVRTWRNTRTLFERVLEVNPKSVVARHNLGLTSVLEGRTAEATEHYTAALELDPDHATSQNNLALLLLQQNRLEEAAAHFRAALRVDPKYARARANLAAVLFRMGHAAEAEAEVRTALEDEPGDDGAHNNLGNFLMAQGKTAEAVAEFQAALAVREDSPDVQRNLARALWEQGDYAGARTHMRRALALRPGSRPFERDLAWFLATDPRVQPREVQEAVQLAERVAADTPEGDVRSLDVLAAAYAAAGRTDDAVRTCDRAIALAERNSPERRVELSERRRMYAAGLPYRAPERGKSQ